jgi:tryptophanyl-tRNA synthetase
MAKKRVVSGVQPTGFLHLGNYVGAVRRWVELQDESECFFFIADLHSLTIPEQIEAEKLHEAVRVTVALYLASGLDPQRCVIFRQSAVPAHAEMGWILTCATPIGWLERMTQYKSKSAGAESVGSGLLVYPALQAADILLYHADYVPVGADQKQHVELTRDIANRMKTLFGIELKTPEPLIPTSGARIMGLDDPTEKMSKSIAAERPNHAILMQDDEATIRKKLRVAVTDLGRDMTFAGAQPGVRNMLELIRIFSGKSEGEIERELDGKGYSQLKGWAADVVVEALAPVRERYEAIMRQPDYLDEVLRKGAERAHAIAGETLRTVKDAVGLS